MGARAWALTVDVELLRIVHGSDVPREQRPRRHLRDERVIVRDARALDRLEFDEVATLILTRNETYAAIRDRLVWETGPHAGRQQYDMGDIEVRSVIPIEDEPDVPDEE